MNANAMELDVDAYLARLGLTSAPPRDVDGLAALQRAHMTAVAFENLDVFHRVHVDADPGRSIQKIVDRRRGGWCFELNGAFAELLRALGFKVEVLGAAVMLDGPATVATHMTLEVRLDQPYLVDVGFGDCFFRPLALNDARPQDGGSGTFLVTSGPFATTLAEIVDGESVAQYRFPRIGRTHADFEPASQSLQDDRELKWSQHRFATRLLDGGPDRVTLLHDRLKLAQNGVVTETPVAPSDWAATLSEWFDVASPE